ncbi:MAG: hypothetical protein DRJ69_06485 [Thermoprotei archaeon]|nr:MAG: hypothetical protein DRJ69_06485 [Thermoprotei archaeon]
MREEGSTQTGHTYMSRVPSTPSIWIIDCGRVMVLRAEVSLKSEDDEEKYKAVGHRGSKEATVANTEQNRRTDYWMKIHLIQRKDA